MPASSASSSKSEGRRAWDPAHGVGRSFRRMPGEAPGEAAPAGRILRLELDPGGAFGIDRRERFDVALEASGNLFRNAPEKGFVSLFGAVAGSGGDQRAHSFGPLDGRMEHRKSAHRKPDQMGAFQVAGIENGHDVPCSARLGIGFDGAWNIGRRIATGGIGDAEVAPRECVDLGLPAPVIAAELVDEDDRGPGSFAFEVEPDVVVAFGEGHGGGLQMIEWRDEMPPSTVMTVPDV